MSDPALVGVITTDGTFTARYLHWSDRPATAVADLRAIWSTTFDRDTAATAQALLGHDWSSLCPSCTHRPPPAATVKVDGVGHALTHNLPVARGQAATAERTGYLEWLYLLDEASQQVVVYEATIHDRWLLHSRHPLDPDRDPTVLGCGGHTADGHRWVPARVALPLPGDVADGFPSIGYEAEVCTGVHPDGFVIARFSDAVADRIAADTSAIITPPPRVTPLPVLRRDGGEFDMVWRVWRGPSIQRVTRDSDGRLLIGAHLLRWRYLRQQPATTECYDKGDRVVLEHTSDPHTRLRPGDEGTVLRHLEQPHTVHVAWDSGSTLAMLPDDGDRIRRIPPQAGSGTGVFGR
jgi:hypothetical protein